MPEGLLKKPVGRRLRNPLNATSAEPVDLHLRTRPILRDPDDEMVLDVASNGDADYIVTHNLKDFAPALELGIAVAAPNEILKRLRT